MSKTRLEAFSDGVIAILITILVLELRVPPDADWQALHSMLPAFLTYVLSFVFLGIYLVGESSSFVLALAYTLRHWMDGTNQAISAADGTLRRRAHLCRTGVHHPPSRFCRCSRSELPAEIRSRKGLQR
jgi:Endosomal/lysosomal potassium channel TMEM175